MKLRAPAGHIEIGEERRNRDSRKADKRLDKGLGDKKWTNLKEENRLKILKSGKLIRGTGADGVSFSKAILDHICSDKDAWRLSL